MAKASKIAALKAAKAAKVNNDPIMLEYDAAWTDDEQPELAELLVLTDDQQETLLVDEEAIEITSEQQALYAAWLDDRNKPKTPDPVLTVEQEKAIAASGNARYSEILQLASQLNADAVFAKNVNLSIDADEMKKRGPVLYMLDLERVWGKRMLAFPVPGSKMDGAKSNAPSDEYQRQITDSETGLQKLAKRWFFIDLADATTESRKVDTELNTVDERTKGDGTKRVNEKARLDGRKSTIRRNIKAAVKLYCQLDTVNALPNLTAGFVTGVRTGEYKPVPIFIEQKKTNATDETIKDNLTVTEFGRLNVEKAIKAAGGAELVLMEHLMATKARPPKKGQGEKAKEAKAAVAAFLSVWSVPNFVAKVDSLYNELQGDKEAEHIADLLKAIAQPDSDDLLFRCFDLHNALAPITGNPALINRRQKALLKISEATGDKPATQSAADVAKVTKSN